MDVQKYKILYKEGEAEISEKNRITLWKKVKNEFAAAYNVSEETALRCDESEKRRLCIINAG